MNYQDYITIEPNKRGGKPCIRGLRITVYEVLEYLASEMTVEDILEDFPDLNGYEVYVCGSVKMVESAIPAFLLQGLAEDVCFSDAFVPATFRQQSPS